jgi:hypothetical protein
MSTRLHRPRRRGKDIGIGRMVLAGRQSNARSGRKPRQSRPIHWGSPGAACGSGVAVASPPGCNMTQHGDKLSRYINWLVTASGYDVRLTHSNSPMNQASHRRHVAGRKDPPVPFVYKRCRPSRRGHHRRYTLGGFYHPTYTPPHPHYLGGTPLSPLLVPQSSNSQFFGPTVAPK